MKKIGLGITTLNRPDYFKQCIDHILKNTKSIDYLVVVNDGSKKEHRKAYEEIYKKLPKEVKVIDQEKNGGCSKAKNTLLKEMIKGGCEHLFICEDDILVLDDRAITEYVRIATEYGMHNLCFALHGPINIGRRLPISGEIAYYPDSVGAFCYYSKEALEKSKNPDGTYFDEAFHNAMEHVELSDRIGREGMTLSFSMFPDIDGSDKYLSEIEGSIENSSIRPKVETKESILKFKQNVLDALEHWKNKDGHRFPLWDLYFNLKKQVDELYSNNNHK
jgi:glycosyltransferase involved in cell wall biosynthesis